MQQRVKKSHYQSMEFVHVSNSRADAVDRLLIIKTYDSAFGKRVLTYRENRGTPDYG